MREREGEKHQCVVASCMPPTRDLACKPGMHPDWESNQQPFGSQATTQSTEPHQTGHAFFNCCSSTVGSIFLHLLSSALLNPTSHPQSFLPLALSMCPLYMLLDDPSLYFLVIALPPPFWLL